MHVIFNGCNLFSDSVMHYNPYAFSKWYFLAPTIKSRAKGASFKRAKKPTTVCRVVCVHLEFSV